jgi:hypothetical protein
MEASGQLHYPGHFTPPPHPKKDLRYPLNRRLGGLQSRYERGGEERKNAGKEKTGMERNESSAVKIRSRRDGWCM